ncbi:hypothetical protein Tco_0264589 [Tanacetum coccineum]
MSSITSQQTKLDLELVPKENRFDIGKCNGIIPRGFSPREPTFQVTLDVIALTLCHPAFLIIVDVPEICPRVQDQDFYALPTKEDTVSFLRDLGHTRDITLLNDVIVDQMHQPWRTFATLINRSLSGKTSGLNKLRLSRAQIIWGMYFQKNVDYVELLWEEFTYQIDDKDFKKQEKILGMKESKAYKTYLGYAIGVVPPKIARKLKKASITKKGSDLVPADEEPVTKGKRINRSVKKSSTKPAIGIELLSEVALTKKAQLKELPKKPPSVEKITPTVTSEGPGDKPGVLDVTEDYSTESESESWEQDEESNDDNQEEEEVDQENESEDDKIESDKDKGMDDTIDQFDDDVDTRLEEPTHTGKEVVQGEGVDVEMIDARQGNENLETTQEQVVEDAHVTISTVTKKTKVPTTSSSRSSDLASKFLNFLDIPYTDVEIVSPFDVPVQHEVPNTQTITLIPIPISVITTIPQSLQTFTPPPLVSTPTPPPTTEATNLLTTLPDFASVLKFNERIIALEKEVILPKEVSNFAPPVIKELIKESRDEVTLAKVSSQPHSTYEAASTLTEFELKKIIIDKMEKSTKSQPKSSGKSVQSKEPVFEVTDSDMPQDQEGNLGDNENEPRNETASRRDWFKKPTPPQEPTGLDWNIGKTTQEGPTQN